MNPGEQDLWFLPLGGTGEIGMNLNLYGHAGQWLMVDCGVTFSSEGQPGPDVQMADPKFLRSRLDQLCAMVITHAHEDHVGAVPYLWKELTAPVYTTAFTAEVLQRKLAEFGLLKRVPIHVVKTGDVVDLGPFSVEWVGLTHSIPEPNALVIRTTAGSIFHTADWKLDPDPVIGPEYAEQRYRELQDVGIDAMVCDSTNATVDGPVISEGELFAGLYDAVSDAPGRVIVTCFGSNLARLHTLARVARETDRHFGLLGLSLVNMVAAARRTGHWDGGPLVDREELGYLPKEHVLVAATGSQGDARAALNRLAQGRHPSVTLEAGDRVVFSSRVIPGNEAAVDRLVAQLEGRGVTVVQGSNRPIHASGHPTRGELEQLYNWVRPALAIPVHGEAEHLDANADVATSHCAIPALVGRNGDLFTVAPEPGVRRGAVEVGRLGWDGKRLRPCTP